MSKDSIDYKIKMDHEEILAYYEKYKSLAGSSEQRKWANQIIWEVARHSAAEEEILYPLFEKKLPNGKQIADKSRSEHLQVKKDLHILDGTSIEDRNFDTVLRKTIDELLMHMKHEENDDLPQLAKVVSREDLVKLGTQFDTAKKMNPTRPHPSAPDKGFSAKVVNVMTAPFDKLRDTLKSFPTEQEIREAVGHH
jgi:hypothetical protein